MDPAPSLTSPLGRPLPLTLLLPSLQTPSRRTTKTSSSGCGPRAVPRPPRPAGLPGDRDGDQIKFVQRDGYALCFLGPATGLGLAPTLLPQSVPGALGPLLVGLGWTPRRRRRQKHGAFITFPYKGCKGTKKKRPGQRGRAGAGQRGPELLAPPATVPHAGAAAADGHAGARPDRRTEGAFAYVRGEAGSRLPRLPGPLPGQARGHKRQEGLGTNGPHTAGHNPLPKRTFPWRLSPELGCRPGWLQLQPHVGEGRTEQWLLLVAHGAPRTEGAESPAVSSPRSNRPLQLCWSSPSPGRIFRPPAMVLQDPARVKVGG